MDLGTFFVQFAVAAGVGGLIGVEREHRGDSNVVIAGVRTFPLVAIAGFLTAFLATESASPFVLAAGILGAFGLAAMFIQMRMHLGQTGLTTPVTMVVTFLLGVLIGYGFVFEGVVIGVVATFLLVTKRRLHRFAHVLDDDEILSALQFMTILFILLPLTGNLPRGQLGFDWIGRGALVDPFVIVLVVVFVSSISFVSLVVMRLAGPSRGVEFSGILGGLVNSEATTASLAQRAREEPRLLRAAIGGAILATTTMLIRNLAIAGFADTSLSLVWALLPFMIPIALLGVFLALRGREPTGDGLSAVRVKNPFAVLPALKFAVIFTAASVFADLAQQYFGEAGVYVTAIGGFVSAGAVVASVASLHATQGLPLEFALRTSLLAMAASVVGKLFILRAVNRAAFEKARVPFLLLSAATVLGAGVSFFVH